MDAPAYLDESNSQVAGLQKGTRTVSDELGGQTPVSEPSTDPVVDTGTDSNVSAESGATIPVVIDGETVHVSVDELTKGYMRQSDYTRKTQTLAEQRKQLEAFDRFRQELNSDPASVIADLQEAFADKLGTQAPAEELDPIEAELKEVKSFIATQKERELQGQLDREIAALHQTFGDFDEEALFKHALDTGNPHLRSALRDMLDESGARTDTGAAAEDELERKRAAALVAGGHSAAAGSVNAGGTARAGSIAEAFRLAKQQLSA